MSRLPEIKGNLGSLSASQFEQFMLAQKMLLDEEIKQNEQNMKYKIFNVKDLLAEIQYKGVRKGTKTEAYLEDVIKSINKTKKYRWVQFFQLVDVFYIVVEVLNSKTKSTKEEIQDHYAKVEPTPVLKSEPLKNEPLPVTESVPPVKTSGSEVSFSTNFPWKNK